MIEIIEMITLAFIPGFLLLDFFIQKRSYNKTRYWRLRGFLVTVVMFLFTTEVALLWASVTEGVNVFNLSPLGIAGGAIVGIVVYEFLHYWYHRFAHQWKWLWRAGHQMHHSAESLDAFGAFYQHPVDAAIFITLASLVFFPLLGVVPEAGVIAALFLTFNAMFQHANINTPRWLGYFIQRPESHCIHHGRNIHKYNYSDLPLWDMVFGTFKNPVDVSELEIGFYKGASNRIPEMLIGKDVSRPRRGEVIAMDHVATETGGS